jgi:hypothetical protein
MADLKVLRFPVEGRWFAHEWAAFIGEVSENYSTLALLFLFSDLLRNRDQHPRLRKYIDKRTDEVATLLLSGDVVKKIAFLETTDFSTEKKSLRIDIPGNLRVAKIQFNSPGDFDVTGFGKLAEALGLAYRRTLDFIDRRWTTPEEDLAHMTNLLKFAKENNGLSPEELQNYANELLARHSRIYRRLYKEKKIPMPPSVFPPPKSA